ncbi:MAG TPA: DUF2155 domain-containing protein [Micavibrio sp.]|jgi:hypothetical protein
MPVAQRNPIRRRAFAACFALLLFLPFSARAEMTPYPIAKLQSLDKMTGRTMTFNAKVGSTVKFGPVYIRVQTCRKAPPIEKPEAAAFLQIWEVTPKEQKPAWIFSGWMYASSPALSPMDHPVYDVWVLDCMDSTVAPKPAETAAVPAKEEEGEPIETITDSEAQTDDTPAGTVPESEAADSSEPAAH